MEKHARLNSSGYIIGYTNLHVLLFFKQMFLIHDNPSMREVTGANIQRWCNFTQIVPFYINLLAAWITRKIH